MSEIVLSLCDRSCVAVLPWAEAGYRCIAVDLRPQPSPHPNIQTVACDVRDYLPPRGDYAMVFAWPPCTHLAVSGARLVQGKGAGSPGGSLAIGCPVQADCGMVGRSMAVGEPGWNAQHLLAGTGPQIQPARIRRIPVGAWLRSVHEENLPLDWRRVCDAGHAERSRSEGITDAPAAAVA